MYALARSVMVSHRAQPRLVAATQALTYLYGHQGCQAAMLWTPSMPRWLGRSALRQVKISGVVDSWIGKWAILR